MTVNGIGERAGSVPYEPLVLSLKLLYGQDAGIAVPVSKTDVGLSGKRQVPGDWKKVAVLVAQLVVRQVTSR